MPKTPAGVVVKNGDWYVRRRYRGADGKRKAVWRKCERTSTAVRETRYEIEREIRDREARETFAQLLALLFQLLCHGSKAPQTN